METPEQVAIKKFIAPAEQSIQSLLAEGNGTRIVIRSDKSYGTAGEALRRVRERRKAFAEYWKSDPEKPQGECGPGEGMAYFARRAWDAANSLFNRFDKRFADMDAGLSIGMANWREESERKAKAEADERARIERERLEAEARKERETAEKERKRLEAEAEKQRVIAEREAEKRRQAELAAAKSKREKEEAERRAREAKEKAERKALEAKRRAQDEEENRKREAEAKEREAENVVPVVTREAPKAEGVSVRKEWRACPAGASQEAWEEMTPAQRDKLCERMSWSALIKAVAAGLAPERCVTPDWSALNELAKAFGGQNPPPGIRFYEIEVTTARR